MLTLGAGRSSPRTCSAAMPFSFLVARAFGVRDVRRVGSGNVGATNVLRNAGKAAGVLAFLLDAGKGATAALVASRLDPRDPALPALAARRRPSSVTCTRSGCASRAARASPRASAPSRRSRRGPRSARLLVFGGVAAATRYVSLGSVAGALALAALALASAGAGPVRARRDLHGGARRVPPPLEPAPHPRRHRAARRGLAGSDSHANDRRRRRRLGHGSREPVRARGAAGADVDPRARGGRVGQRAPRERPLPAGGRAAARPARHLPARRGGLPTPRSCWSWCRRSSARGVYRQARELAPGQAILVSATKGLEIDTLQRMSEVAAAEAPGRPVAALSGPSFALEVARGAADGGRGRLGGARRGRGRPAVARDALASASTRARTWSASSSPARSRT